LYFNLRNDLRIFHLTAGAKHAWDESRGVKRTYPMMGARNGKVSSHIDGGDASIEEQFACTVFEINGNELQAPTTAPITRVLPGNQNEPEQKC